METNNIAPNGEPSNLNDVQYRLVRTEKFKKWFGDWEEDPDESSRMLDDNGEPKIFYHGSNQKFQTFDKSKITTGTDAGWLGEGFYFYGVLDQAQQYGDVKEYFLNIRNPYYATAKENTRLAELNDIKESKKFSENLKSDDYDGVYYDGDLRQETVVFEPDQILSAETEKMELGGEIKRLTKSVDCKHKPTQAGKKCTRRTLNATEKCWQHT